MIDINSFPADSRVWIYISNREFTSNEVAFIESELKSFLDSWNTHGTPLNANGFCFEKQAIVIVANEEDVKASGCSMDKISKLIQHFNSTLKINLLDRFNVLVYSNEGWQIQQYSPSNYENGIHSNLLSWQEFTSRIEVVKE